MDTPAEIFSRHRLGFLQFSGGKDSLATLALLRPWWSQIVVVWCDAGDSFPETRELMQGIRERVPYFLTIRTDAPRQIAEHGWPSDILTTANTPLGQAVTGKDAVRLQLWTDCCQANIWGPMDRAMRQLGATLVIRGQRADEAMKSPCRSGSVIDGIEYWFPIEDWPADRVFAYLRAEHIPIPDHYRLTRTSLDCMHCTGWLQETDRTMTWLCSAHPEVAEEVTRRLAAIDASAREGLAMIERAMQ